MNIQKLREDAAAREKKAKDDLEFYDRLVKDQAEARARGLTLNLVPLEAGAPVVRKTTIAPATLPIALETPKPPKAKKARKVTTGFTILRDLTRREYKDKVVCAMACALGCELAVDGSDGIVVDDLPPLRALRYLRPKTDEKGHVLKEAGNENSLFVSWYQERLHLGAPTASFFLYTFSRLPDDIRILIRIPGAANEDELHGEALEAARENDKFELTPYGMQLKKFASVEEIVETCKLLGAIFPDEPAPFKRKPFKWDKAEAVATAMAVQLNYGSHRRATNTIRGLNGMVPNRYYAAAHNIVNPHFGARVA